MKKVSIKINNQLADLEERDLGLAITKTIGSFNNISERSGSYSFTFLLPKTKTNNKIFGNIDMVQGVNKFNRSNNFEVVIYVSSVEVFTGILKLQKITNEGYECFIIGNEISWKTLIENKTLRDIESLPLTPFIGERNKNTSYEPSGTWVGQEEIWQLTSEDYPVQFPLISYGNFFIGNKEVTDVASFYQVTTLEKHNFHDGDKVILLMNYNGQIILYGEDNSSPVYVKVTGDYTFETYSDSSLTSQRNLLGTTGSCKRYDLAQNYNFIEELNFDDIPPSVYVIPVMKSIFKDIGWSLGGSFVNNSDIKKLIIPFTSERNPVYNWNVLSQFGAIQSGYTINYYSSGASVSDNYYTAGIDFINPFLTYPTLRTDSELFDFSDSFNSVDIEYITPATTEDGENVEDYQFYVSVNFDLIEKYYSTGAGQSRAKRTGILIYKEDVGQNTFSQVQSLMNDYFISGSSLPSDHPGIIGFYDVGDKTQFRLSSVTDTVSMTNSGTKWTGTGEVTLLTNKKLIGRNSSVKACLVFQRDSTAVYGVGDSFIYVNSGATFSGFSSGDYYLDAAKNLPEVKQIDFLKSVITCFNLYVQADSENKVIIFDSYDNFYLPNQFAHNWTDKTNSSDYEIEPLELFKSTNFLYAEDSNDGLNTNFCNYYRQSDSIYASDSQEIETGFSSTWEREYYSILSGETINIPTIASSEALNTPINEVNWDFDYNYRLLYYDGYQLSGFSWLHDDKLLSGYPKCSFSTGGLNLRFDNSGLFENYYSNMFYQIENSFYLNAEIDLNEVDIQSFDIRKPVDINNVLFRIEEISQYKPAQRELTPVKLIKII